MDSDATELRRAWEQRWCMALVEVQGHLLLCETGAEGHEGECSATLRAVRRHKHEGRKACGRHGCDRLTA